MDFDVVVTNGRMVWATIKNGLETIGNINKLTGGLHFLLGFGGSFNGFDYCAKNFSKG